MPKTEKFEVPSIKIFVSDTFNNNDVLTEVLSGVEEESIPYDIVVFENDDSIALSYKAALESVLQVGIGIDSKGYVSVHYKSLPEDKPLFKINYKIQDDKIRSICSNAARLVKGTPFIL